MSQVVDCVFGKNEGEDTEQHSNSYEQISEEKDNVKYNLEDIDTFNESDMEVTGTEASAAEKFKSKNYNL